ncbi:MAG: nuclear transport factor 2 family protein [Porticoccaceae bacterium]|nr:nuclear transport factor 2 family protein [Porticoccaceae bacterium]
MNIENNKHLVTDFFAHFKRKDVQKALDMMTEDATWWIGGKAELFPMCGLKTKEEMAAILFELVPGTEDGLEIKPKSMIAEGNKVACEAESYGVLGNGRIYNNEYHFLIEIRDGKIAAVKEYLDTMHTADVLKG